MIATEYDWIKPGNKYRRRKMHQTNKSIVVIDVSISLDRVEFNYLSGRGHWNYLTLEQFAQTYRE